jgi:hypothetical protein
MDGAHVLRKIEKTISRRRATAESGSSQILDLDAVRRTVIRAGR